MPIRDFQFFPENRRLKNKMIDFAHRFFILFVRLETFWSLDVPSGSRGRQQGEEIVPGQAFYLQFSPPPAHT